MNDYLMHHGVKGQRWGVRRYQYTDGSLTPLGKSRRSYSTSTGTKKAASFVVSKYYEMKVSGVDRKRNSLGNSTVDTYLKSKTPLYRIQSDDIFGDHAFYATYKKHDTNEYAGLFGKNLQGRANYEAKVAEREAKKTGDYSDAEQKRLKADNMQIYQLKIENKSKLKIPSEMNAGHIVGELLKDQTFSSNLKASISDTMTKMRRPAQQLLLSKALSKIDKPKLGLKDKETIYRALNLTLTNHNDQEVAMQKQFYKAMKDNGYSALLDLNDKKYSSYHAQSPVIVFDTTKVALQSTTRLNNSQIEKLYRRYNTERIVKEIPEQVIGTISKYAGTTVGEVSNYVSRKVEDYLEG